MLLFKVPLASDRQVSSLQNYIIHRRIRLLVSAKVTVTCFSRQHAINPGI